MRILLLAVWVSQGYFLFLRDNNCEILFELYYMGMEILLHIILFHELFLDSGDCCLSL